MIIQTTLLYFFLLITILSIIGYGAFIIKNQSNIKSYNIFNYFFLGIIALLILSVIYYILIPNNKLINLFILVIGLILNYKLLSFKEVKFIFLITILLYSGLLISKTHEDFSVYHFQHIKELSDGYIKFGLSNLDHRYFYASIFSYIQTLFILPYFDYYLINIPIYSIYLSLIGYFLFEIIKKKKINILNLFFLIFLVVKFKRFSEFGYDYIGQFLLIYIFAEYVANSSRVQLYKEKIKGILFFFLSILIKISNIYFAPIIIFIFFSKKKIFKKIFFEKFFLLTSFLFLFIFTINSLLKTGCVNYLIKESCLEDRKEWAVEYDIIEGTKKLSLNWSRGFYHQEKSNKIKENEYNQNFNWVKNWFQIHFLAKILPNLAIIISILLIINYLIGLNRKKIKSNNKLLSLVIFTNFIWFYLFPQFRFGIAGLSLLTFLLFIKFFPQSSKFNYSRVKILIIISLIYFNYSNIIRINNEFKREDIYKFSNFPYFSLPNFDFVTYETNGIKYNVSKSNNNFWRSCYNSNIICVNHDDEITIKKKDRKLFIIKN